MPRSTRASWPTCFRPLTWVDTATPTQTAAIASRVPCTFPADRCCGLLGGLPQTPADHVGIAETDVGARIAHGVTDAGDARVECRPGVGGYRGRPASIDRCSW